MGTISLGAKALAFTAIDVFTGDVDVKAMKKELQQALAAAESN